MKIPTSNKDPNYWPLLCLYYGYKQLLGERLTFVQLAKFLHKDGPQCRELLSKAVQEGALRIRRAYNREEWEIKSLSGLDAETRRLSLRELRNYIQKMYVGKSWPINSYASVRKQVMKFGIAFVVDCAPRYFVRNKQATFEQFEVFLHYVAAFQGLRIKTKMYPAHHLAK